MKSLNSEAIEAVIEVIHKNHPRSMKKQLIENGKDLIQLHFCKECILELYRAAFKKYPRLLN